VISQSFKEGAEKILRKLSGLLLSESTVQRSAEAAGTRLGEQLERGYTFGKDPVWKWHKDAKGQTCAYISLDLTGVPQQAAGGGKAEGRMPYVAMVYNAVPDLPKDHPHRPPAKAEQQARYLAGLYNLDELGLQLRRQAAQVGMEQADLWIGLTDGGNGLEEFARKNFARNPILILDFYHPAERLCDLAKLVHPRDEEKAKELGARWCHIMKHQGGDGILVVLEQLERPPRQVAMHEKLDETVNYMRNNRHRMDYPSYQANGWLIGSGSVESACKTVVNQRLKLAGMRWGEDGTAALCHLRALLRSEEGQWDAFWQRRINKPRKNGRQMC
jgi:hypothetical protein